MGITAAQNIMRGGPLTATNKELEEMDDTPFDFLAINKSKELGPAKAKSKLGNNTKISQEQINHILIVGRYAKTMKEVAERTGLNPTTVSKYLQLNGVTKFHNKIDVDAVDNFLKNPYLTFLEISKKCKCGHKFVSDRANILGIAYRDRQIIKRASKMRGSDINITCNQICNVYEKPKKLKVHKKCNKIQQAVFEEVNES